MSVFTSIKYLKNDADLILGKLKRNKNDLKEVGDPKFDRKRKDLGAKVGIYAIFENEEIVYIGKTKNVLNRFRDHFIKKSERTASKISKVKESLSYGNKIEVSFVEVPEIIYSSIEEILIQSLKGDTKWNEREG